MVVYLYPKKDSLLNGFSVKVPVTQNLDTRSEFFEYSSKNSDICDQLEPPLCVLTFLSALFHNVKFFDFSLDYFQIRFRTH